jgi:nucleoside-diphosphate-sugar epimerase
MISSRRVFIASLGALTLSGAAIGQERPIVMTGHKGRVGSVLVPFLREKGLEVAGVDIKDGPEFDIADTFLKPWPTMIRGASAVVHLAVHQSKANTLQEAQMEEDNIRRNDTEGSLNVIHVCEEARVPIVFASSTWASPAAYGNPDFPAAKFPINWYGVSKLATEEAGRHIVRTNGVRFTTIRIGFFDGNDAPSPTYSSWYRSIHVSPSKLCELFWSAIKNEGGNGYTQIDCLGSA